MAELKTKPTSVNVKDFIKGVANEQQRKDALILLKIIQEITGEKPKMWGSSIIGFGDVHLKYASGRELDWFKTGFSLRKQNLTLYLCGTIQSHQQLLKKLGKHKTGGGCLYINKLEDVDLEILKKLIEADFKKTAPLK